MLFDDMVERLKAQFDAPQETIVSVVNERYKCMVAEAKWRTAEPVLGFTESGEQAYDVDANIVQVRALRIGTVIYDRASTSDFWELDAGERVQRSGHGSFAEGFGTDGQQQILLSPTPTVDGDAIVVLGDLEPDDMVLGRGDQPIIPSDLHRYLLAGARADLYEETDERTDLAAVQEQKFELGIQRLRARRLSRVGSQPGRILMQGRDFDWR